MNKTDYLKFSLSLIAAAVLLSLPAPGIFAQNKTKSLCEAGEQTIWSCLTTKNKIASVCAAPDLTADRGYVQYRFGTAGKIELEFPQNRAGSRKSFRYARYTRPLVTMLTLEFENGGFRYELHDDDNAEEKPPVRAASIDVKTIAGKDVSSAVCRLPVSGSLMKLEDFIPRDEEQ